MLFFEPQFFVFFTAFFALYWLLRRRLLLQNLLILAGSYIFYGAWDVRFLILIAASTSVDYVIGLALDGERPGARMLTRALAPPVAVMGAIALMAPADAPGIGLMLLAGAAVFIAATLGAWRLAEGPRRRALLAISVAVNLGILGVFKYFNFFAAQFEALLTAFGLHPDPFLLNIVLPVGISFYTFQTMSYTIDIWRGQMKPTRNIVNFAAFVAFFPQLVAGPIERASHLLPQFFSPRQITWNGLRIGAALFLWGMFKKVVVADNIAPLSDAVFSDPAAVPVGELLAGVLAFTFQIYCDFSGYSDMALGIAAMLGFSLMVNFRMPYFSRTPSEFWQRWHISLSSWLRDYLYVPLGGNRHGTVMTYRNLMLTMLLGGLWHGAAWTFIAWGALHGAILVIYRVLGVDAQIRRMPPGLASGAVQVASAAALFAMVITAWVFFRAQSFGDAFYVITHMWTPVWSSGYEKLATYVLPLVLAELLCRLSGRDYVWERMPWFGRLNIYLALGCAVILLAPIAGQDFIYFDF